jgi:hypothetical protein
MSSAPVTRTRPFPDIPPDAKRAAKLGFTILASLTDPERADLAKIALKTFETSGELEVQRLSEALKLSSEDAGALMSAISFTAAMISTRDDPAEEVFRNVLKEEMIDAGDVESAVQFTNLLLPQRTALKEQARLKRLSSAILPSLVGFHTTLDVRFGFSEGQIDVAIPVAIAHIHTDVDSAGDYYFQMDKNDVQEVIEKLQKLLERFETAEKWAAK